MGIVVDYKSYQQYLDCVVKSDHYTTYLPVSFYDKTAQNVLIYKITQKTSFYISSTSSMVEPNQKVVDRNVEKYLDDYRLPAEIPDEGRCYLVDRITGDVIFDIDIGRVITWEHFSYYPKAGLYTYLVTYDCIADTGDYYTVPTFVYETTGIPMAVCMRYQTRKLLRSDLGGPTLAAEDLLVALFEDFTECKPMPYGAARTWAISPQLKEVPYPEEQLVALRKVTSRIMSSKDEEDNGIVNGRYFSLKWILEHKKIPDVEMVIIRDVILKDNDLETYIDSMAILGGRIEVAVWDFMKASHEKLSKEFDMPGGLFVLTSSLKKSPMLL